MIWCLFSAHLPAQQPVVAAEQLWQKRIAAAETLEQQGSYSRAKEQFELALAAVNTTTPDTRQFFTEIHLAAVSGQLGEYTEAKQWGNQALRSGSSLYGSGSSELAVPLMNLAIVYQYERQYANSEQTSRRALELLANSGSPRLPVLAATLGILGVALYRRGAMEESEKILRQGIDVAEKLGASDGNILAENLSNLAQLCRSTGRRPEAASLLDRAYVVYEGAYGAEHPEIAPILTALATLHADSGNYPEAIQKDQHAVELAEKAWGPNHPLIHDALLDEASWLRKLHRKKEAKALESRAKAIESASVQNSFSRYAVDARDLASLKTSKGQ